VKKIKLPERKKMFKLGKVALEFKIGLKPTDRIWLMLEGIHSPEGGEEEPPKNLLF
jgi:hypothetical protein